MVKKVKSFIAFILFSFFYTLFSGKPASAANYEKTLRVYPASDGKILYNSKTYDLDYL